MYRYNGGVVGWSGGAKVLGELPGPGRPTNLDYSRARAYCACSRCGRGLFAYFHGFCMILLQTRICSPLIEQMLSYKSSSIVFGSKR